MMLMFLKFAISVMGGNVD